MNQLLVITTKCRGNEKCIFEKKDIYLDIIITNTQETEIGFPIDYLRKTGPIIKLVDTYTQASSYIKTNIADFELREKFTFIESGQSIDIEWVITREELEQFGGSYVDVSAEITIMTTIQVGGKEMEFRDTDILAIVSKGVAQNNHGVSP